ncbi:MAG: hypothetical protein HY875_04655 [Chloroflexi bacterium]|nr:hypothetical protein [Chloroflexota bacterium]
MMRSRSFMVAGLALGLPLTVGCVDQPASSATAALETDPRSDSTDFVQSRVWISYGNQTVDRGDVPLAVERFVNMLATVCYDDVYNTGVTAVACKREALNPTAPPPPDSGPACYYSYCQQQVDLCIAYRAAEAAERLDAFELEVEPLSYGTATDVDQRPGLYRLNWVFDGSGLSHDAYSIRIKLPPQSPADKTLLFEVALEYFKEAVIQSGAAAENPSSCLDDSDDSAFSEAPNGKDPDDPLPSDRQIFLMSFQEAAERLDEMLLALTNNEFAVSTQAGSRKGIAALAQFEEWNAPRNSRLSAGLRFFGRGDDGKATTDLGKCDVTLDRDALDAAVSLIRRASIPFWTADADADFAIDMLNAIRVPLGEGPIDSAATAAAELARLGTTVPDLGTARSYMADERDTFARVTTISVGDPIWTPRGTLQKRSGISGPPVVLPVTFQTGQLAAVLARSETDPLDQTWAGISGVSAMAYAGDAAERLLDTDDLSDTEKRMMRNLQQLSDNAAGDRRVDARYEPLGGGQFKVTATLAAADGDGAFVLAWDGASATSSDRTQGLRCLTTGRIEGESCKRSNYILAVDDLVPTSTIREGWQSATVTHDPVAGDTTLYAMFRDTTGQFELVQTLQVPAASAPATTFISIPSAGFYETLTSQVLQRSTNKCSKGEFVPDGLTAEFVPPLENELTEDSDSYENSWRHYLDAASTAAEVADRIGEDVIAYGLACDTEAAAAEEKVLEICGNVGDVDWMDVPAEPGDPPSGSDSAEAQGECIGENDNPVPFVSLGGPLCVYYSESAGYCECQDGAPNRLCDPLTGNARCPMPAGDWDGLDVDARGDARRIGRGRRDRYPAVVELSEADRWA